jgi:hypothetical protein
MFEVIVNWQVNAWHKFIPDSQKKKVTKRYLHSCVGSFTEVSWNVGDQKLGASAWKYPSIIIAAHAAVYHQALYCGIYPSTVLIVNLYSVIFTSSHWWKIGWWVVMSRMHSWGLNNPKGCIAGVCVGWLPEIVRTTIKWQKCVVGEGWYFEGSCI